MKKEQIVWDLSEMYSSTTDSSLQKDIDDLNNMAQNFAGKYQGRIKSLSAKELLRCIKNLEEYLAKLDNVATFAGLSFNANMTLHDTQSLYDKVNKVRAKLDKTLAFFNIELGSVVHENPSMIHKKIFRDYRHFLEKLHREVPHQLSETEEKLVIEKDQFGIKAWEELRGKWLNTRKFEVKVVGKKKTLSFGEAFGLTYHPDRPTRESATKSIYGVLGKDGEIFSSALRNICNDWLNVCDRRKYDSPMEASLIANDIDTQTIDNLLKTVKRHVGLYQRYLRLKAKIMKLPKLGGHDLFAPIPGAPKMKFDHDRTRELIVRAYSGFDEDYAFAVKDMFAKNHIDSTPRLGKSEGAFCAGWISGKTAFILNNFTEALTDVYTLAHELGHATHAYYCEHSQTVLNLERFPMIVAETASVFGELLLTDLLLSQSKSVREKKAILCRVLDEANGMIFRPEVAAMFEQSLYDAVKQGEYLDYEAICRKWKEARSRIYGGAVEWFDELEAEWARTPHYYMPNFRFYNYPYAYAQLFVYALYQKYLDEGKKFVPKLKKVLSAGSSISPAEFGKVVGLDVTDAHFWELGMKQYEHFVEELERIATQ